VAAESGQIVVAYVDANNYRSLISESRVGPLKAGIAEIHQRRGRLRYWRSPLCRRVGLVLAQTAVRLSPVERGC
jgi:hypothetical protein